jgi:transcriptional regulator with XRE-family HTH domain
MEYNLIENGRRLQQLRGEKTREEVANAARISVSALTMYELGQRNPRDDVKCSLADFFGVRVSDIFFPDKVHSL